MNQPLKVLLTEASLDFALRHITAYYDTDFFPRAEEFVALRHSWADVKTYIQASTIDDLLVAPPLVEPWPKSRGGYRIVHRPEPLDSLIYTAFAKIVAASVEAKRAKPTVACAYRFTEDDSSFFSEGTGFAVYREQCELLAQKHEYVLSADIADFYNKIYLHRLQNAIQSATDNPQGISKRLEYFLTSRNTGASQGIPVGPAASIVMSEATLMDADQFFFVRGVPHVRYVDDFTIFGDSKLALERLLEDFVVYLHEQHRLSLAPSKTSITTSKDFLANELNNQYQLEKLEILHEIEVVNPYTQEVEESEEELVEDAGPVLAHALEKLTERDALDLGIARAVIRRARAHQIVDIATTLLSDLAFFRPVINDVALYLDAVTDSDFCDTHGDLIRGACLSDAASQRSVRLWLEWYVARHKNLLMIDAVRTYVFAGSNLRAQAQAALSLGNQAWVKDHKNKLLQYGSWDRRSILLAAQLLSKDEREYWLKNLIKGGVLSKVETWMAQWILDGAPDHNEEEDVLF